MNVIDYIAENGHATGLDSALDYVGAPVMSQGRVRDWCATEYNRTNAWNVNFSSGNVNTNTKNNGNRVRAVAALSDEIKTSWVVAKNDCLKKKYASLQGDKWRTNGEWDLWQLVGEVYAREYKPSTSTCFLVNYPKLREIFAANFRDRIVHHWVCLRLEPLFEAKFKATGDVSFNCRKGYGTLKAVEALRKDIYDLTPKRPRGPKLCLRTPKRVKPRRKLMVRRHEDDVVCVARFDLRAFFMNIDRAILWRMLKKLIVEEYYGEDKDILLYLTEIIVFHRPELDCVRNSPVEMWLRLEPSKSLFNIKDGKGEPIGNLPSQQFANFYMSDFDGFAVWLCARYGCRYKRFVDDFTVVGPKRTILKTIRPLLTAYLERRLLIRVHRHKFYIQRAEHGVAFIGSVIRRGRAYLSNRTAGAMLTEVRRANAIARVIAHKGLDLWRAEKLRNAVCALNSYIGFCRHHSAFRLLCRAMLNLSDEFWRVAKPGEGLHKIRLKDEYTLTHYLKYGLQYTQPQRGAS